MPEQKETMTIPEAAEILSVHNEAVRQYILRGILKAEKEKGIWTIETSSVMEFVKFYTGRVSVVFGKGSFLMQLDEVISKLDMLQTQTEKLRKSVKEMTGYQLNLEKKAEW